MESQYVVKITDKGQITLPKELRKAYNFNEGDYLLLFPQGEGLRAERLLYPRHPGSKNLLPIQKNVSWRKVYNHRMLRRLSVGRGYKSSSRYEYICFSLGLERAGTIPL